MKIVVVALFTLAFLVLVGCSSSEPAATVTPVPPTSTPPPPTDTPTPEFTGDPERGREIFENGTEKVSTECSDCHSLDGSEKKGPSLQGISDRAEDRILELSAIEYLRQSIIDPSAYFVEGFEGVKMSSIFRFFSEEEVDDVIAFLLTQ